MYGINSAGDIVGSYGAGCGYGFLDIGGAFTTIADQAAICNIGGTIANGINDSGQIVGYYNDATGQHGFLDIDGAFTTIDDGVEPVLESL